MCEIERLPASTPFISLTTLTTLGGGVGCGGAVQFRICFFGEVGLGGVLKHSTWGVYLFVGLGVGVEAWGWDRCLLSVHLNLVICPSSCGSKSGGSNHGGSSPQGCINKKIFGDPKFRFSRLIIMRSSDQWNLIDIMSI